MIIVTNLLTNMVVVALNGLIPTNTAAFQHYALEAMVSNANYLASRWNLDLPTNLTTNDVTAFCAEPCLAGVTGDITLRRRFGFRYQCGWFGLFRDKEYTGHRLGGEDFETVKREWLGMTNCLDMRRAQQIAEAALLAVGLGTKETGFEQPHKSEQWKHWTGGKEQDFPYFEFHWESSTCNADAHVSGVVSNIVEFHFAGPKLRLPKPPNYLEILGYPTNTVFVRPRVRAGTVKEYEVYEP